ncbi:hypothetical protein [Nostoc sp.]|uniref:hypothetical protein n=1 Tax=Nostoc sp. TaxID=1180 RepID=UPI002FFD4BF9
MGTSKNQLTHSNVSPQLRQMTDANALILSQPLLLSSIAGSLLVNLVSDATQRSRIT